MPRPRRPAADRRRALVLLEGVHDQRQRARHEQRPGDALQRARADQRSRVGCRGAQKRRDAEPRDPCREDPPPPEEVAERSADQQERAEREQVGVDDPLLRREAAVEVSADRRQRDVHERAVEEHGRGAEDAREQRQLLGAPPPHDAR